MLCFLFGYWFFDSFVFPIPKKRDRQDSVAGWIHSHTKFILLLAGEEILAGGKILRGKKSSNATLPETIGFYKFPKLKQPWFWLTQSGLAWARRKEKGARGFVGHNHTLKIYLFLSIIPNLFFLNCYLECVITFLKKANPFPSYFLGRPVFFLLTTIVMRAAGEQRTFDINS